MSSPRDLITDALRLLERIGATETPDANDVELCRLALNDWLDAQNASRLLLFAEERNTYGLVNGQAAYTIGVGGNFNQARPVDIDRIGLIYDPSATDPVEVDLGSPLSQRDYANIPVKSLDSNYPVAWYYDHGFAAGLGTITFYPVPSSSTPDVAIYTRKQLAEIASGDMSTTLYLPQGYRRMLKYNLAVEVAAAFGVPVTPEVARIAVESKSNVMVANASMDELSFPSVFTGRRPFNVLTGS